jgi:hypothetical protein
LVPVVLVEPLHLVVVDLAETQVFQRFQRSVEPVVVVHVPLAQRHHRRLLQRLQMVELVVAEVHQAVAVAVAIQLLLHQPQLWQVLVQHPLIPVALLLTVPAVPVELLAEIQLTSSAHLEVQTPVMVVVVHLQRALVAM